TRARAGRPREALALCHRALELAPAGSQRTPDVLSVQGWARTILGDPAGVEDNYEAVRLARRHVPTRLAAALGHSAEGSWVVEGPQAALAAMRESREVALQRGTKVMQAVIATFLALMFDLGLWDELLATAREWRPRFQGGLGRGYLPTMEPPCAAVLCWRGAL